MLYKVSEFVCIYLFYVPWFGFAFSRGVPCSFTCICSFRRFTLSFSFRRLFGARLSTARVSLVVVMASPASANTAPLEPNVVIASEVHDAAEVDDTDQVDFDLDELKKQLGIDSILEKFNDLAAKFCSEKTRTEYFGSEAQNSKSSSETAEGVFDPSAAVVYTKSHRLISLTRRSLSSLRCSRKPKVLGLKWLRSLLNVSMTHAQKEQWIPS